MPRRKRVPSFIGFPQPRTSRPRPRQFGGHWNCPAEATRAGAFSVRDGCAQDAGNSPESESCATKFIPTLLGRYWAQLILQILSLSRPFSSPSQHERPKLTPSPSLGPGQRCPLQQHFPANPPCPVHTGQPCDIPFRAAARPKDNLVKTWRGHLPSSSARPTSTCRPTQCIIGRAEGREGWSRRRARTN